ncbi:ABC transporter substrate-binding protein [Tumebacillus avium]|uniref:ABC transporter substrate-binding protein n=1 Tax=Tumebacillus avium TaxID=1903704 RepID=UPI001E440A3B|nr:ABC transporter substrate-binding protein [Tumebacillus avium]
MWKNTLLGVTMVSLMSVPNVTEAAAPPITIKIDGQKQTYDSAPYMKNDRTLVPLRGIFEKQGAEVFWKQETNTVVAVKGDMTITLKIGSKTAYVNGAPVTLDQAAEMKNDRTMVPIRFVSETLGADVKWEQKTNSVLITSGVKSTPNKGQVLHLSQFNDVDTLDSVLATDTASFNMISQINEGLTRLDKDGKAVPGVAKSWTISPDGKTYRFTLRPDAKWSDGSAVTASDFDYAWKRGLKRSTGANYAFLLTWIKGGQDYYNGTGSASGVGIKVIDPKTLEVTLESPIPFFPEQLAFPTYYPQKKAFVEQKRAAYGNDAGTVLSNGPFKLHTWAYGQLIYLEKNNTYWDRANVKLQKVNVYIGKPQATQKTMYTKGQLDLFQAEANAHALYQGNPEYHSAPEQTSGYLQFNMTHPVLKNKKIRQALTYAIDANQYVSKVYNNGTVGATGLVPYGISNGQGGDFRTTNGDLLNRSANLPKAKALLQEGLKELGLTQLPTLTVLMDNGTTSKLSGVTLQEQWHQNLGVEIETEYVSFAERLERSVWGDFQIVYSFWGADYNDPMTFLDMYLTDSDFNETRYSNPEYDRLVMAAQKEVNAAMRMQYLYDAEKILMNDLPVAPVLYRQYSYLLKPYVKNLTLVDNIKGYDLKNVSIEGK